MDPLPALADRTAGSTTRSARFLAVRRAPPDSVSLCRGHGSPRRNRFAAISHAQGNHARASTQSIQRAPRILGLASRCDRRSRRTIASPPHCASRFWQRVERVPRHPIRRHAHATRTDPGSSRTCRCAPHHCCESAVDCRAFEPGVCGRTRTPGRRPGAVAACSTPPTSAEHARQTCARGHAEWY